MNDRHPNAGLLKDVAVLDDAGDSTSSLLPVPAVHSEFVPLALLCLKSPNKLTLLKGNEDKISKALDGNYL